MALLSDVFFLIISLNPTLFFTSSLYLFFSSFPFSHFLFTFTTHPNRVHFVLFVFEKGKKETEKKKMMRADRYQ
jgi:hypothetical protein